MKSKRRWTVTGASYLLNCAQVTPPALFDKLFLFSTNFYPIPTRGPCLMQACQCPQDFHK